MKNFVKLFAVIGFLTASAMIAAAQEARGLYIGYSANAAAAKPPKPPRKPKKQDKVNGKKPPVAAAAETNAAPTPTGLPGTKITIELNRRGNLSFVRPSYKFRSGDKIRLRLQTNFEGYISLLNVGSNGEVGFLYPYEGADNRIFPSKDVQIPASDAWIVFDEKTGTENLTVIMSKAPLGASSDDYKSIRQSDSRDLVIEYASDGVYAVIEEEKITKPVGFTIRLTHGK